MKSKSARRQYYRSKKTMTGVISTAIYEQCLDFVHPYNSNLDVIGIYWPLVSEADLRPLKAKVQCRMALPVSDGQGGLLYRIWNDDPLDSDACGIPAPSSGAALTPDQISLLLVPALAIDHSGIRLGYGGGYYDRLRAEPAWAAVPAWVVLPSSHISVDPLPRDSWDVPFNGWITERGAGRPS